MGLLGGGGGSSWAGGDSGYGAGYGGGDMGARDGGFRYRAADDYGGMGGMGGPERRQSMGSYTRGMPY